MSEVRVREEAAPPEVTVTSDPASLVKPDMMETAVYEIVPEEPAESPFPMLRLVLGIALIVAAAFPLFFASVWASNYVRYVRRQSSVAALASQTELDRARSTVGREQITPGLAPFALFILIESGATWVIAPIFGRKKNLTTVAKLARGAAVSVWVTVLLQIPFWILFSNLS